MEQKPLDEQIAGLAALDEPLRRSLYFFVVNRREEVSRDAAAQAMGVSAALAGFHLDRLVQGGLLESSFRRLTGRTGPGAGRPAKLYCRSGRQLAVSLPHRSYELAARILVEAVDVSGARQPGRALQKSARLMGERIGADARATAGPRRSTKRLVAEAVATLSANGYEPECGAGEIRLRNCPFHSLVQEHKALVCGMNLALIKGVVAGLDVPSLKPVLDPMPGMCCVALKVGKK